MTSNAPAVVDTSPNPTTNMFKLYFLRQKNTKEIGWWKWLQMAIAEAIFGEELLESIVICRAGGTDRTLNQLIPHGIFIDRARDLLVEVLFYKYCLQYYMIISTNMTAVQPTGGVYDLTYTKFQLKPGIDYQLIYFRRVYHTLFIAANIAVNLWLFFFHDSMVAAVASFAIVQLFRRAKI